MQLKKDKILEAMNKLPPRNQFPESSVGNGTDQGIPHTFFGKETSQKTRGPCDCVRTRPLRRRRGRGGGGGPILTSLNQHIKKGGGEEEPKWKGLSGKRKKKERRKRRRRVGKFSLSAWNDNDPLSFSLPPPPLSLWSCVLIAEPGRETGTEVLEYL